VGGLRVALYKKPSFEPVTRNFRSGRQQHHFSDSGDLTVAPVMAVLAAAGIDPDKLLGKK
jgi:hypothetical protein